MEEKITILEEKVAFLEERKSCIFGQVSFLEENLHFWRAEKIAFFGQVSFLEEKVAFFEGISSFIFEEKTILIFGKRNCIFGIKSYVLVKKLYFWNIFS